MMLEGKISLFQNIILKIDEMKDLLKISAHGNLKYSNILYDSNQDFIYLMDYSLTYKAFKQIYQVSK